MNKLCVSNIHSVGPRVVKTNAARITLFVLVRNLSWTIYILHMLYSITLDGNSHPHVEAHSLAYNTSRVRIRVWVLFCSNFQSIEINGRRVDT
jgi:hypothetical protein